MYAAAPRANGTSFRGCEIPPTAPASYRPDWGERKNGTLHTIVTPAAALSHPQPFGPEGFLGPPEGAAEAAKEAVRLTRKRAKSTGSSERNSSCWPVVGCWMDR